MPSDRNDNRVAHQLRAALFHSGVALETVADPGSRAMKLIRLAAIASAMILMLRDMIPIVARTITG